MWSGLDENLPSNVLVDGDVIEFRIQSGERRHPYCLAVALVVFEMELELERRRLRELGGSFSWEGVLGDLEGLGGLVMLVRG